MFVINDTFHALEFLYFYEQMTMHYFPLRTQSSFQNKNWIWNEKGMKYLRSIVCTEDFSQLFVRLKKKVFTLSERFVSI